MSPPASSSSPSIVVDLGGTSILTFRAFDSSDNRFSIQGRIDTYSDYLAFRIRTRILSTGERSVIPPDDYFDAMMTHFSQQPGGLPAAIHAIWTDRDSECLTNLNRFNAALAAGDIEAVAAGKTFTGRMAAKYNYTPR